MNAITKQAIPLKTWLYEEAERKGLSSRTVYRMFQRGQYAHLKLDRRSKRTIFVLSQ